MANLTAQNYDATNIGLMGVNDLRASMAKLFRHADVLRCGRGSVIVQPGIEPPGVFYVYEGFVKSYGIDSEGRYNLLSIKQKGEVFPFEWAMRQRSEPLFYEAMCDVTLKRMSRDAFTRAIEKDSNLTQAALRLSLNLLSAYGKRIHTLELPTVGQRLAARLLYLAENFGAYKPGGIDLELPCNYQDLADSINSTRDTVNRELLKFKHLGIITVRRRKIRITSREALVEYMASGSLETAPGPLSSAQINDLNHGSKLASDIP